MGLHVDAADVAVVAVERSEDALAARIAPFLSIPGVWPFNATRDCSLVNTLDTRYDPNAAGKGCLMIIMLLGSICGS